MKEWLVVSATHAVTNSLVIRAREYVGGDQ